MNKKKFLKAINQAKNNDIIIWNEATDEVIRGQPDSWKIRNAIQRLLLYKFHTPPKKNQAKKEGVVFEQLINGLSGLAKKGDPAFKKFMRMKKTVKQRARRSK